MPLCSRPPMLSIVALTALSLSGNCRFVEAVERGTLMRHELAASLSLDGDAAQASLRGNGDVDSEDSQKEAVQPASAEEDSGESKEAAGQAISTDEDGQPDTEDQNPPTRVGLEPSSPGRSQSESKSGSESAAEDADEDKDKDKDHEDHEEEKEEQEESSNEKEDEENQQESLAEQRAAEVKAAQEYLRSFQPKSQLEGVNEHGAVKNRAAKTEEEETEDETSSQHDEAPDQEDSQFGHLGLHPEDMKDYQEESLSEVEAEADGISESWPVPVAVATDGEKEACDKMPDAAEGVSAYWKGTNAIAADKREVAGSYTDQAKCLEAAKKACFITTAIKWDSKNQKCYCLYGNVAPEGGSGHHMWICKLKKSYMAAHCTTSIWMTGTAQEVTRSDYPTNSHSANACAIKAKGDGCDAAEMPRGNSGKCTCVRKINKEKALTYDTTTKLSGVCPIETV
eukprot:CAMPEP_0206483922 /NCGR_PEP_ID=MMETSP0324_2-20121206/39698_1 /ASSEMBLY_ACC=CAM_ASM_000836 /TAXON_ID=2866 /ORGANISM="Crypthecodinium cohnii, Strain Seligo" /LENGTH=453 /DNA_ID=CAMNT_0053962033 /DNA_START=147 /DNA_END=1506 /DNA_ORIENTATION=+